MEDLVVFETTLIFRPQIHAEIIFGNIGGLFYLVDNRFARILLGRVQRMRTGMHEYQGVHLESQLDIIAGLAIPL